MSGAAILVGAKTLIRDPQFHTRQAFARSRNWVPVVSASPLACSWCALGALTVAEQGESIRDLSAAREALNEAAFRLGKNSPSIVNDELGHAAVMKMFDEAIEIAREAEE